MTEKIIAYRLVPVFKPAPGGFATTAMMTCMATEKTVSTSGGGGEIISTEFYDRIKEGEFKTSS